MPSDTAAFNRCSSVSPSFYPSHKPTTTYCDRGNARGIIRIRIKRGRRHVARTRCYNIYEAVKEVELLIYKYKLFVANCALMCYYAACSDNSLPTFRDNLSVPSSRVIKNCAAKACNHVVIFSRGINKNLRAPHIHIRLSLSCSR